VLLLSSRTAHSKFVQWLHSSPHSWQLTTQWITARTMEGVQNRALRAYVKHSLSAALTVQLAVKQRCHHVAQETFYAAELWLYYCGSAQTACGVLGLLAIDRAESSLLYWLQSDVSFEPAGRDINKALAIKLHECAKCYASANKRQLLQDPGNAALWTYIGTVYDEVDAARIETLRECHDGREVHPYLSSWRKKAIEFESPRKNVHAESCAEELTALREEVGRTYRSAIAQVEVTIALFGFSTELAHKYHMSTGHGTGVAAKCLESSLSFTEDALQYNKKGEHELHALRMLCARYMRNAAEESSTCDFACVTQWEYSCESISGLEWKLAEAVRCLKEASAATPSSQQLHVVKQQLSRVFQQINESWLVTAPQSDGAHHLIEASLKEAIKEVRFTIERVTTRAHELSAAQRMLATANKVNANQSPAHKHIKQCWLIAAEQTQLAAEAASNAQCKAHKLRSSMHERLALGPLATTAEYFSKADCAATPLAKELWSEAAHVQLTATLALVERCDIAGESFQIQQAEFTEEEAALVQRARMLAEGAVLCGPASPAPTAAAVQSRLIASRPRLTSARINGPHAETFDSECAQM
jgi:hypothetical protein